MPTQPPVWLRGPVPDIAPELQGVAHGLLEAVEEVKHALVDFSDNALWINLSGAASVGFHLRHLIGATDRLLTYARDEPLSATQRSALVAEQSTNTDGISVASLLEQLDTMLSAALMQLQSTDVASLNEPRFVGKQRLPSTVRGLLEHSAQHACRHSGQIVTTAKMLHKQ